MPPSPIPAPLPLWARALLQIAPLIPTALQATLEYIHVLDDSHATSNSSWRRFVMTGQPVGSTDTADHFATSMDIVNITGGVVDDSWTDADYTTVTTHLLGLMNAWAGHMSSGAKWNELRAYRMAFTPLGTLDPVTGKPKIFETSGPPERVFVANYPGLVAGTLPPQCAITHTDRNAFPRHWGRNYWPWPAATKVATNGYVTNGTCDIWASDLQLAYSQLMTSEFFPVTVVRQAQKTETKGLLTTNELVVDNVFDIVRRRRSHLTTYRATLPTA